jgi:Caspase domain
VSGPKMSNKADVSRSEGEARKMRTVMRGRLCGLTFSIAVLVAVMSSGLPLAYSQKPKRAPQRGVQDAAAPHATGSPPAKYYALVIGNNNYPRVKRPLKTPINDATAVAQLLHDGYGFRTELLRDATRDQILTALVFYRRTLAPNSNLLIYYAGHGYLDREAGEAYWIPVDGDEDNIINWISADDITRAVKTIPSKHVLVISDSCYSGAILSDDSATRDFGPGLAPREHIAYLARLDSSKSRNWMASGSKEPVADDGAPGHSIFAAAVLQGLNQMKDAQFAASDLFYAFVKRKVAGNAPQLPQYGSIRESGDDLGDFIFSRDGTPPPSPDDIPPPNPITDRTGPDIPISYGGSYDAEGDRNAITALLHQYEEGRKRKDANALWKIWPSAPVETKQRIEAYFKSAASIRTTLQMDAPEIGSDHLSATVTGQMREAYTPKNGDAPPARDADIAFTLKKNNGVWAIVDVK